MRTAAGRGRAATPARSATGGLALLAVLALGACGGGEPAAPVTETVEPSTATAKGGPPEPEVPVVWPLTGVPTEEVAARPALAVKIENARQARPQTGLEDADMVWEEVVEGGITRFVAVYHSRAPELVGPVRSVRPMDPAIVAPLHGVLAYTGGQPPFVDAVGAAGVQSVVMDEGDDGFVTTRERRAPHNVYGDLASFWAQADADRTSPPPAQLEHAREPGAGTATREGAPAGRLDVTLTHSSRAVWDWAGDRGAYVRSEGDAPAVSADGDRIAATNVVLVAATMVNTSFRDPAGVPVPETQLVGSGDAVVASGGKHVAVTWSKDAVDAPLRLTGADGLPVHLEPGATWIELVPTGSGSWAVG
ncbi:DUF3048 domain-containing protein [Cellulosimicrobium sp. CUA-896]|uniref:DUF3048 domain-containing protein n=1 Tax=Cellulosimicrobium sp. CUA-896 TaxID=1517881 RepID=UPI000967CA78|nr:DUF3048 domain-containing protein [Cellulosimicrobium sp. CUA-896]OLT54214.1 hypothetical protein BJF88_09675 [Cellulosimicrobium sp. CUA-896]